MAATYPRDMTATPPATAVVLAGGRSSRFGEDKLAAPLRGTTVLDHLLGSLPGAWPLVLVGPPRETVREVVWTREEPPGAGPLAAVLAGALLSGTGVVAVVAGDMPDAAPALHALVTALHDRGPDVAAVVGVDEEGVANPLLAAYRTADLRSAAPRDPAGAPARRLLDLPHERLAVPGPGGRDVDTPADLASFEEDGRG